MNSVWLGLLVLFSAMTVKCYAVEDISNDKYAQLGRRLVLIAIDEIEADWHRLQRRSLVSERSRITHLKLRHSEKQEQLEMFFAARLREAVPQDPDLSKRLTMAFLRATRYAHQKPSVKFELRTRLETLLRNLMDEPACRLKL